MKTNELRIGNYVTYNPKSVDKGTPITPLTVSAIDEEAGVILNDGFQNVYNFGEILPIPLTPEILEKCGFEWETTEKKHLQLDLPEQEINKRYISFLYIDGKCEMLQMYMSDYFTGYFEIKHPLYLHQLQNLYHSLTGEELPIDNL